MKDCFMKMHYHLKLLVGVGVCVLLPVAVAVVAHASDMDSRIESSAQGSYVYRTYLKDDAITIKSTDGAVTLTGSVAEESHKSLAKEIVANLPGVKSVDDQLVLKEERPAENSDGWIGMKVKTVLLFHHNVNAFKTEVNVKDGVVTLKGEASSQAQKDLVGEYAKDVNGVKDVRNEMTLAQVPNSGGETLGEMIDDASITTQVKMALLFHHSTSAVNTKVATSDGVVTVSGMAKNDAEKELVSKLASDIKGVTSVVNNMAVVIPATGKKQD